MYLILIFKNLFEICDSHSSIFGILLSYIDIFQKICATEAFQNLFTNNCLKAFIWSNIANSFNNSLAIKSFTDIDTFSILTFNIPLAIFMYIHLVISQDINYIFNLIYYFLVGTLGSGFGFIGENTLYSILFTTIPFICIIILFVFFIFKKRRKYQIEKDETETSNEQDFIEAIPLKKKIGIFKIYSLDDFVCTKAIFISLITFFVIMIPYLFKRFLIQAFLFALIEIFCTQVFLLEKENVFDKYYHMKFQNKIMNFLLAVNILLTIPRTEIFLTLLQSKYKMKWNFYVGYVMNTLLLPAFLIIFMVIKQHPSIQDKYKKRISNGFNYYLIIEIIDILQQLAFSIASAFNSIWGCISIEIGWVLLIIIVRPYNSKSIYVQYLGSSFVMFVSYGLILYAKYNNILVYGFNVALILVLLPFLVLLISSISYYLFDFEIPIYDSSSSGDDSIIQDITDDSISLQSNVFITILWFSYGLFIPNLFDKNE